jgi:hypothetical protein
LSGLLGYNIKMFCRERQRVERERERKIEKQIKKEKKREERDK